MNIYFVRHGQTETNVKKIWNGKTDLPLSKIGLHQSKELVVFFKNTRIDVIYSSPLIRARKTASPLAKSHKLKVIIDERLSERNFGSLELKPTISKDIYDMSNWDLNSDLDNGVETIQDMYFKRIKPFIDQIIKIHSKKTIVVVAHSWVGRLFNFYFSNKDKSTIAITPKNGVPIKYKI